MSGTGQDLRFQEAFGGHPRTVRWSRSLGPTPFRRSGDVDLPRACGASTIRALAGAARNVRFPERISFSRTTETPMNQQYCLGASVPRCPVAVKTALILLSQIRS